jgi:hypothetical protein
MRLSQGKVARYRAAAVFWGTFTLSSPPGLCAGPDRLFFDTPEAVPNSIFKKNFS